MNNKGFTLIELLATIVILSILAGITIISVTSYLNTAKKKSEVAFINNIKDGIEVYLDYDAKKLSYTYKVCEIKKTHGVVNLYKSANININTVINSSLKPLSSDDLTNPATNKKCESKTVISLYRDDDYVYYYKINKTTIGACLLTDNEEFNQIPLTTLPEECKDK